MAKRSQGDRGSALHRGRGYEFDFIRNLDQRAPVGDHELGVTARDGVPEALPGALAVDALTSETVRAFAAVGPVQVHDAIADRKRALTSDRDDFAGELVAQDRWQPQGRESAARVDQISPAHRRSADSYERFVRSRLGIIDAAVFEQPTDGVENDRVHERRWSA